MGTFHRSPYPVPEDWSGYQVYHCSHPSCGVYWLTKYDGTEFFEITEDQAMGLAFPLRKSE